MARASGGERLARDAYVRRALDLEQPEVRVPSHQHDLDRGVLERQLDLLRHDRDPSRDAPAATAARAASPSRRGPTTAARAAQQPQERGLAGTVGSEHADELAQLRRT